MVEINRKEIKKESDVGIILTVASVEFVPLANHSPGLLNITIHFFSMGVFLSSLRGKRR